ncbi:hypothetical protein CSKR_201829 [Clonorchis sinensis]|uniref:Uncharacterized protein n=1 Tax=Clonorchis sinensis TaxID=79923 RepID=A0A8T1MY06_CLOSI|nr:hypothetical protein CSKR_201829 [Clonorchis sinensis]
MLLLHTHTHTYSPPTVILLTDNCGYPTPSHTPFLSCVYMNCAVSIVSTAVANITPLSVHASGIWDRPLPCEVFYYSPVLFIFLFYFHLSICTCSHILPLFHASQHRPDTLIFAPPLLFHLEIASLCD